MNLIEKATRIAVTAHKEQIRKTDGSPYVAHPLTVAFKLMKYNFPDEVIAAAGIDTYIEIPLDKNFLDGGASYFANGLTFGLKNNELLYIEALAISSD